MVKFEKNRILWEILLLWGAWILISFSLTNGYENLERFIRRELPSLIGFIIIIHVNVRYLLPKFFLQKKHFLYVLAAIFLLVGTVLFMYHEIFPWSDWFHPHSHVEKAPSISRGPPRGARWMRAFTPLIIAFLGSTLVEIIRFANKKEQEAIHSAKEKLETELKFLKSQVNPHFLFNALNNIYSLAVMQAPQTPESVMQLSEILRYMVYDSNEEKVPLKSEINYIENFVELQLLKDSRGIDVTLDLDKNHINFKIAPLLLIPLVENAFKHSKIENLKNGFINIQLKVDINKLDFRVVNSIPANDFTKDEIGGVGLENTKKRLELLYPNKQHELKINQTNDQFEVILKITAQ